MRPGFVSRPDLVARLLGSQASVTLIAAPAGYGKTTLATEWDGWDARPFAYGANGQPCIRGLRMTVQDVLEYLASGMSVEEILADFPDLTAEDIRACLAYAADRERRLRVIPAA